MDRVSSLYRPTLNVVALRQLKHYVYDAVNMGNKRLTLRSKTHTFRPKQPILSRSLEW